MSRPTSSLAGGTTSALSLEAMSAGYGRARILNDVSLALEEHELVGILGANGAGKSTLLR
ncbi:MAG TPA: ATP-binding cassette domain-containing protein, partial [Acidimicrobiales bacterium]|nr:ATP-binding cassette domain-containing protein [Acidimicrobiales bacterium]